MKSVFVFIATFLVATAASTGAKLVLAKPPAKTSSVADSTKRAAAGDSVKTDTAIAVSGRAAHPAADTVRPAGAPSAPAAPDSSKAVAAPKALARGATPAGAPAATKAASGSTAAKAAGQQDTAVVASERRIAKVFTSMDAKQAAKVLEHMTDNDVEVILGYVGPRQAASIMSELPPERVATLSKLAIKDAQNGSKR